MSILSFVLIGYFCRRLGHVDLLIVLSRSCLNSSCSPLQCTGQWPCTFVANWVVLKFCTFSGLVEIQDFYPEKKKDSAQILLRYLERKIGRWASASRCFGSGSVLWGGRPASRCSAHQPGKAQAPTTNLPQRKLPTFSWELYLESHFAKNFIR